MSPNGENFTLDDMDNEFANWEMTKDEDLNLIKMVNLVTGRTMVGFQDFRSEWFCFEEMGVSREDKNPMIAFAQLMWNLV